MVFRVDIGLFGFVLVFLGHMDPEFFRNFSKKSKFSNFEISTFEKKKRGRQVKNRNLEKSTFPKNFEKFPGPYDLKTPKQTQTNP